SIQLAARASSEGIAFSLEDLFEHDTVAALAAALQCGEVTAVEQIETSAFGMLDRNDLALLLEEA
ncbi:hypothetical protein J2X32_004192, partial [Rheinheimera pacifica]|uniref:phosphopantetheine-binding protein n=1 Tax=Rheinheimera pacifica TaxID=173990 RepID=UPI0028579EB0